MDAKDNLDTILEQMNISLSNDDAKQLRSIIRSRLSSSENNAQNHQPNIENHDRKEEQELNHNSYVDTESTHQEQPLSRSQLTKTNNIETNDDLLGDSRFTGKDELTKSIFRSNEDELSHSYHGSKVIELADSYPAFLEIQEHSEHPDIELIIEREMESCHKAHNQNLEELTKPASVLVLSPPQESMKFFSDDNYVQRSSIHDPQKKLNEYKKVWSEHNRLEELSKSRLFECSAVRLIESKNFE